MTTHQPKPVEEIEPVDPAARPEDTKIRVSNNTPHTYRWVFLRSRPTDYVPRGPGVHVPQFAVELDPNRRDPQSGAPLPKLHGNGLRAAPRQLREVHVELKPKGEPGSVVLLDPEDVVALHKVSCEFCSTHTCKTGCTKPHDAAHRKTWRIVADGLAVVGTITIDALEGIEVDGTLIEDHAESAKSNKANGWGRAFHDPSWGKK